MRREPLVPWRRRRRRPRQGPRSPKARRQGPPGPPPRHPPPSKHVVRSTRTPQVIPPSRSTSSDHPGRPSMAGGTTTTGSGGTRGGSCSTSSRRTRNSPSSTSSVSTGGPTPPPHDPRWGTQDEESALGWKRVRTLLHRLYVHRDLLVRWPEDHPGVFRRGSSYPGPPVLRPLPSRSPEYTNGGDRGSWSSSCRPRTTWSTSCRSTSKSPLCPRPRPGRLVPEPSPRPVLFRLCRNWEGWMEVS